MIFQNAAKVWRLLYRFPRLYLIGVCLIEIGACAFVCRTGNIGPSLVPNWLGIDEMAATRHIHSAFLPIGYPALLGLAELPGSSHGVKGMHAGIFAIQILMMILIICLSRAILIHFSSARFATTTALVIGMYPQYISGVNRVNDANLTLLTLMLIILTLLNLQRKATIYHSMLAGSALACGVIVRPNLILMAPLVLWSVFRLTRRAATKVILITASMAILVYACVTGLVHGRPFFPENGPYNLYAGLNSYTETTLLRDMNAENSIVPAMRDRGIYTELHWRQQADIQGINDPRDEQYIPFFNSESRLFLQHRPTTALKLCGVKLWTLMRQNYDNKSNESGGTHKIAVLFKRCILLLIPFWFGLLIYSRLSRSYLGHTLFSWMFVLYVAPFVLTNADPRFRITIEGIVLLDIARMLYLLARRRSSLQLAPVRRSAEKSHGEVAGRSA